MTHGFVPMLLALGAGFLPGLAAAADTALELELGSTRYQSTERNAVGTITNQDSGSLPRATLTGRWQQEAWFAEAVYSVARHDIAYQGYTQIGIPLQTTTELAITEGGGRAGYRWTGAAQTQWQLALGLERRQINRNILPGLASLPLREVLTVTRAVVGGRWQRAWPTGAPGGLPVPVTLSAGLEVLQGLQSRLDVDSYGLYDPVRLEPGRSTDWRVNLKAQAALGQHTTVWLGYTHESFQPGSSSQVVWTKGGVPAAAVRYPGSRQSLQTLVLGLGWAF